MLCELSTPSPFASHANGTIYLVAQTTNLKFTLDLSSSFTIMKSKLINSHNFYFQGYDQMSTVLLAPPSNPLPSPLALPWLREPLAWNLSISASAMLPIP